MCEHGSWPSLSSFGCYTRELCGCFSCIARQLNNGLTLWGNEPIQSYIRRSMPFSHLYSKNAAKARSATRFSATGKSLD